MPRSSWLDEEKTERHYPLPDGAKWIVQNEYQPVTCPHCAGAQYQRLTHIWHIDRDGGCTPEYHANRSVALDDLKALLVTYIGPDQTPVCEVEQDGCWVLMAGDKVIARAE